MIGGITVKKAIIFTILLVLFTVSFGSFALAEDWACPNCGRVNDEDMYFCGSCRTEKPTTHYAVTSDQMNAWVCSACDHICPVTDSFCTKCGADHKSSDEKAVLMEKPVITETRMKPCNVQRIPCTFCSESVVIEYTAYVDGIYYFWLEDQSASFDAKMILLDRDNRQLKANEFYGNDPGLKYRLSAGDTCRVVLKGNDGGNPYYVLCIGEPRSPEYIDACCVIQDSIEYYYQENTYLFVPETSGEYRLEITEMQNGQELDLKVIDDLGYEIKSSYMGVTMGHGITFDLEAGKLYHIVAVERRGWIGNNSRYYKMLLSRPNPMVSVTGCTAIGDYVYYQDQVNRYEYVASETKEYLFRLAFKDSSCEFRIRILDEYGYTVGGGGWGYSSECSAELEAGRHYQITVEQCEGTGSYSLFIQPDDM